MAQELSQEKLEEMVEGKATPPTAVFFDKATVDILASKEAGRKVYRTLCYIKETQPGVTDWVAVAAQAAHKKEHPEAYAHYLANRQGERSPSVNIIPGIRPEELQELIDFGIPTIRVLAAAQVVPPHLLHLQTAAKTIESVLKETENDSQEDRIKSQQAEQASKAKAVPETDRPHDPANVGRPTIPDSPGSKEGNVTEGLQEGGRFDSGQGLSSNWSIQF